MSLAAPLPATPAPPTATDARARELYEQQRAVAILRVNHSFVILMACQFGAALLGWCCFAESGYLHFWNVVVLGVLYTGVPIGFAVGRPTWAGTRHVVAAGQVLMSTLLIGVSHGRIETHFHIFGSLAFLSFYRDWRVLVTATAIVTLDHLGRGVWWPESVYGVATVDHWRWLEHAGWLVFEDAFLILSMRQNKETLWNLMERRAELERARDAAEQASRAKDEFIAVLSHELRTPLTPSLLMLSSLTEDEQLPAETREELALVRRNVELEARLIDDLLDLTRIVRGKLQLNASHVDLHVLISQLLQTCRSEFQEKGVTVKSFLGAQKHWIYGDSARLQQVFWNLLKNGLKFTPAGGVVEVHTSDAKDRIKIDVADNGVGIAADILPKIFQRFEQGGASVTRQFGGLGLGLSICRAIVEMHRGAIRAESRGPGWGATFTVVLPGRIGAAPTAKTGSQTQILRLSGKLPRRVLLVDDHADTRETLRRLLARAGYEVTAAGSVQGALQKLAEGRYDLLVSDIGLPDGSGCDLMQAVQAHEPIPGIALSGFGMDDDVRRSLEAGFVAHLTKPIDFQRLKEEMSRALIKSGKASPPEEEGR